MIRDRSLIARGLPLLLGILGLSLGGSTLRAQGDEAWQALERYRAGLHEDSPFSASFTQSFLPSGFSTAETESGVLALSLPECLRWDYDDPFPKSFILCGDVLHYWNPEDEEGHREELDARRQPGLDLLLLEADELRDRYVAELLESGDDGVAVQLTPLEENDIVSVAVLRLDARLRRLTELIYTDPDGNRTSFRITDYVSGLELGRFNPPQDREWLGL